MARSRLVGPGVAARARHPPGDVTALLDRFRQAAAPAIETAGPGYLAYVGGGPRFPGGPTFLTSRGCILPHGAPADPRGGGRSRDRRVPNGNRVDG